jgi:hypothetical protein
MQAGHRSANRRDARGIPRGLGCAITMAVVSLALAATAGADTDTRLSRVQVDRVIGQLRIGLAIAGLVLFAAGMRGRARGVAESRGSGRRILLGVVAALAFACNYNLFAWTGLHRHELYHYYLGSKYFPELGYFDLYTCSVQAAIGDAPLPADLTEITDLRSKRRLPAAEAMANATPCRDAFTPERWDSFRSDLGDFQTLLGESGWHRVLRDHGYNPSPAWTLIGRTLSTAVPPTPSGLWFLARIDLALLALLFGAIGAAFGFEAMCIGAIAWGASGHTRYQWTGDALLRQSWFAASVAAVCLMRKGRPVRSGALLALASLERVFPACFFFGYGLRELCVWIRERKATTGFWRFVVSAGVATIAIAAAGTVVAGRGIPAWFEFAENTQSMIAFTPKNALGFEYALRFTTTQPPDWEEGSGSEVEETIQAHKQRTLDSRRGLQFAGFAIFAALFAGACWRGSAREPDGSFRLADWEALAMGAAAIPFLTMPASYYLGFVVIGAALATRRPRIGIALLLATLGWSICVVYFPVRALGFAISSWILLAYAAWSLAELWLPARRTTPRPL